MTAVLPFLPWATRSTALAVLAAFEVAGLPLRFVGGCVRDAYLGQVSPVVDLDAATTVLPEVTMQVLSAAGLKAVPTGAAFGTITAVGPDGDKMEITTLREDIETDGRHAVVKFGTDWAADAARRDFTINALYAEPDGTLYDYFDGLADLSARRVRFIGDASTRIAEDYLRVLRFFRFSARFADACDEAGLAACTAARAGMYRLSRERVWQELAKIATLSQPAAAFTPMVASAVLPEVLPAPYHIARLQRLADYEHDHRVKPQPALRLAALSDAPLDALQQQLRLSQKEQDWVQVARASMQATDYRKLAVVWYQEQDKIGHNLDALYGLSLLLLADDDVNQQQRWDAARITGMAANWAVPVFPLTGADMLALGVPTGPRVGELLALLEEWWLEQQFHPSRADCLVKARELVQL